MIKRYINQGFGKTGTRTRIARAVQALTILLSATVLGAGVARGQTITFAGDADQGEGGRWMRSKVEQFSKETGIQVKYIARPVSATEHWGYGSRIGQRKRRTWTMAKGWVGTAGTPDLESPVQQSFSSISATARRVGQPCAGLLPRLNAAG
jgi:hypothetical protein